jgi:WD40 repeat protein
LSADGRYALSGSWDKTVRFWELKSGNCLRTLEHESGVTFVGLSADGRHAVSACKTGTLPAWFLDWDLEENEPADWDEGARPYLEAFLSVIQPYGVAIPKDGQPTDEDIKMALHRQDRPTWSDDDFKGLLRTLGCAGYGWLRPGGVRHELEQMIVGWSKPN